MNKEALFIYEEDGFCELKYTYGDLCKLFVENNQLKEQLKSVEALTCFNLPDNINLITLTKPDYERNIKEYETLDKYKTIIKELRSWLEEQIKHGWKEDEDAYKDVLKKLDELEGDKNDGNIYRNNP